MLQIAMFILYVEFLSLWLCILCVYVFATNYKLFEGLKILHNVKN